MKHYGIRLFLLLAAVLVAWLVWLWFDAAGNLRNVTWQAPAPIAPDLGGNIEPLPAAKAADVSQFMVTLDRPLFSPNRRPAPPPPKEGDAKPAPDPLAGLHLFGLYTTDEGASGMLVRLDGKMRRVGVNETLGGWKLQAIREREVTLVRDGEERVIPLAISRPATPAKAPAVGLAGAVGTPAAAPATSSQASAAGAAERRRQEMEEAQRDLQRRRNELRARSGAKPVSP